MRPGVIYQIPCECGVVYFGETGRTLKQRKDEHSRAVKRGDHSNALALHLIATDHNDFVGQNRSATSRAKLGKEKNQRTHFDPRNI